MHIVFNLILERRVPSPSNTPHISPGGNMSPFPGVLLLVLCAAGVEASAMPEVDFFRDCPPSNCSAGGPEVRYPLRLNTSSPLCGAPGLQLHCSGHDTLLLLPSSGVYKVTGIDYTSGSITLDTQGTLSRCSPASLPVINVTGSSFQTHYCNEFTIVNCSVEINRDEFRGPIGCLGVAGHFAYAAKRWLPMDMLPATCDVVATGGVPPSLLPHTDDFCDRTRGGQFQLPWWWYGDDGIGLACLRCEGSGGRCGFSSKQNKTTCYRLPSRNSADKPVPVMLIAGTTSAGVGVIVIALLFLYITRKSSSAEETRLKVEKFLAAYRTTKPTRYTGGDIRKITRRFKHKLGRGGFGSVYKGELPNGIPVAVKMLDKSMGDGEDFMNEVATTGTIHHANVVHLLGFCSEGPRRALVYEFMPNGSLENFIFSKDSKGRQSLGLERLEEIAVGIARGIEYLHQGCKERILHFDIKPHNILLDHNFSPKISDFGMAKLCSRDQSIVSMTMARGTMGYIAPEVYSRNFGTVSYKSDVYSFGMLLMEMVSGRNTLDPTLETSSQVYFPQQIYDRLILGEDLESDMGIEWDEEIARKLAIVALWCIQWNPNDRPSMTRVVQMLAGSSQGLQIPPNPFVTFS